MEATTIQWKNPNKEEIEALLHSNIKYIQIDLGGTETVSAELLKILEKNKITNLIIKNCQLSSQGFQQILEATKDDLDWICINNSVISGDVPLSEIQQPKLQKLTILAVTGVENWKFLKYLLDARGLEFIAMENGVNEEEIDMIVRFLASQKKLEMLKL
jgi:hypothetical protein